MFFFSLGGQRKHLAVLIIQRIDVWHHKYSHIKLTVNKSLYQVPVITPPPMSDSRTRKILNILLDCSKPFEWLSKLPSNLQRGTLKLLRIVFWFIIAIKFNGPNFNFMNLDYATFEGILRSCHGGCKRMGSYTFAHARIWKLLPHSNRGKHFLYFDMH